MLQYCDATIQQLGFVSTSLCNSGLCWTIFAPNRDTAVPAEGNGDLQTLICVLVARPRRYLTLSNPVPWQNWMAAYLVYTLQMKTLFCGWQLWLMTRIREEEEVLCSILMVHSGRRSSSRSFDCSGLFNFAWFTSAFRAPLYLRSSGCDMYSNLLRSVLYLWVSWAWWDWSLIWLTNHCPSVLWHRWLGHWTRKIVSRNDLHCV